MQSNVVPPEHLVQIEFLIKHKLQINSWIITDEKFMNQVLQYVFWSNRNGQINQSWFKTIFSLIQIFKFPILHTFKKAYERIRKMKLMTQFKKQLCQISHLVRRILLKCSQTGEINLKFFDLQFYQVHYTLKIDSEVPLIINQEDRRFMKLISDLTSLINHFQKKVNNLCNKKDINIDDSAVLKQVRLIENIYNVLLGEKKKAAQKCNFLQNKLIEKMLVDSEKIHQKYQKFIKKYSIKRQNHHEQTKNASRKQISNKQTQGLVQKLSEPLQQTQSIKKSRNIFNFQNEQKPKNILNSFVSQEPIQILSDSQEMKLKNIKKQETSLQTSLVYYKTKTPLCCRQFFVYDQALQSQNMRIQYKNYNFPFQQFNGETLLKTICSFLNSDGGIIYMGVQEDDQTFKRLVKGMFCNQKTKELILKYFRVLNQRIYPDIVANKLYEILFVPIKKSNFYQYKSNKQFIQGRFIIKIIISPGLRKQLYSYKDSDGQDKFFFRTQNQVISNNLKKDIRKLLDIYKERILNPRPQPEKIHEGKCLLPEKGFPSYKEKRQIVSSKNLKNKTVRASIQNKKDIQQSIDKTYFDQTSVSIEKNSNDKKTKLKNKIKMKAEARETKNYKNVIKEKLAGCKIKFSEKINK